MEYDKINGYPITPKTKIEDAIKVNKIILVNPGLSEKLIRKKVEIKIRALLKVLEEVGNDPNGGDEGVIQATLMEAEHLKITILNRYVKYLGNTYCSFSINKMKRRKLFENMNQLYYLDEEEPKKGRGR